LQLIVCPDAEFDGSVWHDLTSVERVPCTIVEDDIGDEDKRVRVFDVWAMNRVVNETGFTTKQAAQEWANAQGYLLT